MSHSEPTELPRKKPTIVWWLCGLISVLVLSIGYELLGPNPAIIVSPQTTFITTPLQPNGLPDYEQYLLSLYRAGVTPENNAAAVLWPSLWPSELPPSQYHSIVTELGLKSLPYPDDSLAPLMPEISRWSDAALTAVRDKAAATIGQETPERAATFDNQDISDPSDELLQIATSQPWTSEQLPFLAKWVHENQEPIDQFVKASHRTRCYFPSPTLLDKTNDPVNMILLPGQQAVSAAGEALGVRAMWSLGEGKTEDAWQDLLAANRIAHLVSQGYLLVEQLVAMQMADQACTQTVTYLHEAKLSPDEARAILRDLQSLQHFDRLADCFDKAERVLYLDTALQASHGSFGDQDITADDPNTKPGYLEHLHINWNTVLRRGNETYDRCVAALRLPDFTARREALDDVDGDLARRSQDARLGSVLALATSPAARSDAVAARMVSAMLPGLQSAVAAQDHANTMLDLTRIAAALAIYRAEMGKYPASLDELTPHILDKTPVDSFHAKPFIYKQRGEGYLLYSAGPDGTDDGGSNETLQIIEGKPLILDTNAYAEGASTIPIAADDIAITVPPRKLPLPKIVDPKLRTNQSKPAEQQ